MKTLFRLLTLVGIFALWGQARAYEVVIDIDVSQEAILGSSTNLSGSAWVEVEGSRQQIDLSKLNLEAPSSGDGEEWAIEWLAESAPDLIMEYGAGLDPDLMVTEIDLRKHKLRCKSREQVTCKGQLSIRLTVSRS